MRIRWWMSAAVALSACGGHGAPTDTTWAATMTGASAFSANTGYAVTGIDPSSSGTSDGVEVDIAEDGTTCQSGNTVLPTLEGSVLKIVASGISTEVTNNEEPAYLTIGDDAAVSPVNVSLSLITSTPGTLRYASAIAGNVTLQPMAGTYAIGSFDMTIQFQDDHSTQSLSGSFAVPICY